MGQHSRIEERVHSGSASGIPFEERVLASGGEYQLQELNDFVLRLPLEALRVDPYQYMLGDYSYIFLPRKSAFT